MATNTANTAARLYHTDQTGYLKLDFTYADAGTTLDMGYVPAGAVIIRAGVVVKTAFDGDTTNTVDIGPSTDTDGLADGLALGTVGAIASTTIATSNDCTPATDTLIQCAVVATASPTAGEATAWIEFFMP